MKTHKLVQQLSRGRKADDGVCFELQGNPQVSFVALVQLGGIELGKQIIQSEFG